METRIRLKNIKFFGFHGVMNEEKIKGQNFEIDIEVIVEGNKNYSDDIRRTINYSDLYDHVNKIFQEKKYNLIETLAKRILTSIQKKYKIKNCKVVIRKPNAPMKGKLDAVEIEVVNSGR